MASNMLTNLRGPDPNANRQTDAISRLVEPVCKAVMATPIMGAKPPAWIRPPLENGFIDLSGWVPARYHKDALGYVHVQAAVTSPGGAAAGSTVFTLPVGARPGLAMLVSAYIAAPGAVGVYPQGNVATIGVIAAGQSLQFSFSFLAEQ